MAFIPIPVFCLWVCRTYERLWLCMYVVPSWVVVPGRSTLVAVPAYARTKGGVQIKIRHKNFSWLRSRYPRSTTCFCSIVSVSTWIPCCSSCMYQKYYRNFSLSHTFVVPSDVLPLFCAFVPVQPQFLSFRPVLPAYCGRPCVSSWY